MAHGKPSLVRILLHPRFQNKTSLPVSNVCPVLTQAALVDAQENGWKGTPWSCYFLALENHVVIPCLTFSSRPRRASLSSLLVCGLGAILQPASGEWGPHSQVLEKDERGSPVERLRALRTRLPFKPFCLYYLSSNKITRTHLKSLL